MANIYTSIQTLYNIYSFLLECKTHILVVITIEMVYSKVYLLNKTCFAKSLASSVMTDDRSFK